MFKNKAMCGHMDSLNRLKLFKLFTTGKNVSNQSLLENQTVEPGNIGKSAFCKYMVVKHHATVVRGGKLGDIMNIIFNTDMDKCNYILFDIPRGTGGHVSYTSLEAILDELITNTKYASHAWGNQWTPGETSVPF